MNIKQLKDFREKLKHAKKLCARRDFDANILINFIRAELRYKCADTETFHVMPDDVYVWYINQSRTPAERKAMWDNSIQAVDARIANAKRYGITAYDQWMHELQR